MREVWERLPVPVEHLVAIAAGVGVHGSVRWRLPRWSVAIGGLLGVAGAGLNAWAVRERPPGSIDDPAVLVTGGPQAISRNPMYVGWSLVHVGLALAARSPALLITWPLAAVAVHRGVLREERELALRFGARYEEYTTTVPRYLPTLRHPGVWSDQAVLEREGGRRRPR